MIGREEEEKGRNNRRSEKAGSARAYKEGKRVV